MFALLLINTRKSFIRRRIVDLDATEAAGLTAIPYRNGGLTSILISLLVYKIEILHCHNGLCKAHLFEALRFEVEGRGFGFR